MSWLEFHRQSERLASEAEIASRQQDNQLARHLYLSAAQAEEKALLEVEIEKSRTYGITAVSAVSLYFKASEWQLARSLAHRCLGTEHLPAFAYPQLDDLLDSIKIRQAVVDLDGAYMLVSVRGGEVLPGGAPLDLVVAKNQRFLQALALPSCPRQLPIFGHCATSEATKHVRYQRHAR